MGIADKDYFLDVDGNVTTDEQEAHQLLIRQGQNIPKEMADKYDIGKTNKSAEKDADGEKASGPASNKAAKAKENK